MKVIISKEGKGQDFSKFIVFTRFSEVKDKTGIDTIVFHSSEEGDFNVGVILAELSKKGKFKFIYINENPSQMIKMCLSGIDGYYYPDEFYLDDEDELLCLLDTINNPGALSETALVSSNNIKLVEDFIQAYIRGESCVETKVFQSQVVEAINQLSLTITQQDTQLAEVSTSALQVFEKASNIISALTEKQKELTELTEQLDELSSRTATPVSFANNISYFPPQKYGGNCKVLLVKQYTPCKYLVSFLFGFKTWLHTLYGKKVRLVFILGNNNNQLSQKYSTIKDSTIISSKSISMTSMYDSDVVILEHPQKEAFTRLWGIPYDLTIAIDMMPYDQDMVSGPQVSRLNAVAGLSDITRLKLDASKTIASQVGTQSNLFYIIKTIGNYPKEEGGRKAAYQQLCASDGFNKLKNYIGI